MAYRNGTYVAFNGCDTTDPTISDLKYYALLKAWNKSGKYDFSFSDSHEKTYQVNDESKLKTLIGRLLERLRNSKNFLLIITDKSSWNRGLLNWEIERAVTDYTLPIIAAYPGYEKILQGEVDRSNWPSMLQSLVDADSVRSIHIPFKQSVISKALDSYNFEVPPEYTTTVYNDSVYSELN